MRWATPVARMCAAGGDEPTARPLDRIADGVPVVFVVPPPHDREGVTHSGVGRPATERFEHWPLRDVATKVGEGL